MLSIIVCSINPGLLAQLQENLEQVTGVEYELLYWDNRDQNLGICEVYNKMAEKARFQVLCFIHEDIAINTNGWGNTLLGIFNSDPDTSIIGIAGGKYKGRNISGWYSGIPGMDYYNISHRSRDEVLNLSNKNAWSDSEEKVVCIDGVFIAVRKNVWENNKFNEELLTGFHFYDIDFSLKISQVSTAKVTSRIDVIHFTQGGDYGNKWIREAFKFHDYWRMNLPVYLRQFSGAEVIVAKTWLERLQIEKISFANKMRWIKTQNLHTQPKLYIAILKFLLFRPSGAFRIFKSAKKIKKMVLNG